MNVTTNTPVAEADVAEAAALAATFNPETGKFEPVGATVSTEEDGFVQSEGDIATPADVTVTIH